MPATWWCPCPSRGVPENTDTITCGRNARTTVTTSVSTESCGQCWKVSAALLEKPKSYARVKYWCAPSMRRAASSSSVRITPSASPSSLPMRFCPPSPRVSDRYATSMWCPLVSHAMRRVSSSSGCAPITSTRVSTGSPCTSSPSALAPRAWHRSARGAARETARRVTANARCMGGFSCRLRRAAAGVLYSRGHRHCQGIRDEARLLLRVRRRVPFRRTGALWTTNVANGQRVPDRGAETRRDETPRGHVAGFLLRPHHIVNRRVALEDGGDGCVRPRVELLHAHDRDTRRALMRKDIVVQLARAEHETPHLVRRRGCRGVIHHGLERAAREIGEMRRGRRQAQQALGLHEHEWTPLFEQRLAAQHVEILRGRGRIRHAHVLLRAHLQEALEPRARVFGPLPFVAVRQQQHQPAVLSPLGVVRHDELIHDGLRDVREIAELRLPQDNRIGRGHAVAVLESQHRRFGERRVVDLEAACGVRDV